MKIAVIKYNAGNILSVMNTLERIGFSAVLTDCTFEIQSADKVIFPGVGEASSAMNYLMKNKLLDVIKNLSQPVLGICLGMQLLSRFSSENETTCFGLVPADVFRLPDKDREGDRFKVPHVGWNTVLPSDDPLFHHLPPNPYFYFVHSYAMEENVFSIATTKHSVTFSSAVRKDNFYGVQFHPEKSSEAGEQLLKNFLNL